MANVNSAIDNTNNIILYCMMDFGLIVASSKHGVARIKVASGTVAAQRVFVLRSEMEFVTLFKQ
jgi:hypothetical protein